MSRESATMPPPRSIVLFFPHTHSVVLIVAVISVILDILLCLASLYPYYMDVPNYSLSNEDESGVNNVHHSELLLASVMPLCGAIFSLMLCLGNRMRNWVTYVMFLISNTVLLIWNFVVVLLIYTVVMHQLHPDTTACSKFDCTAVKFKMHTFAFFLILCTIFETFFNVFVWRGWMYLKKTKDNEVPTFSYKQTASNRRSSGLVLTLI